MRRLLLACYCTRSCMSSYLAPARLKFSSRIYSHVFLGLPSRWGPKTSSCLTLSNQPFGFLLFIIPNDLSLLVHSIFLILARTELNISSSPTTVTVWSHAVHISVYATVTFMLLAKTLSRRAQLIWSVLYFLYVYIAVLDNNSFISLNLHKAAAFLAQWLILEQQSLLRTSPEVFHFINN